MTQRKSLKDKFAIVGLGMIVGPNDSYEPGRSLRTLEAEAARLAIADAGLNRNAVDGYIHVHGGPRSGDGSREPTDAVPRVLGLPINFYYRLGRGGAAGAFGLASAIGFLEYGMANYIVVSGARDNWSMGQLLKREGFTGGFGNTEADGSFGVPLGETDAATTHSFLATRHMAKFGTTSEQLGAIAVQQRQWANMNPLAQMYHKPMTLEDHQKSPILVWPYHRNDMAVQSDAAIAVVITTDDRARDLKRKPVRLKGIGFDDATKEQWWSGPGNYESLPVAEAKKTAFGMAEIGIEDLSMAQLYDCFTGEVLVQLEDYGFCKKGEGGPFAAEGHLGPGGKMPCNTSGGLLSAYHMGDLTGIAESVTQLRGEAGERQVAKSNFSLVTGHGGELLSPGLCSTHSALILGV